MAFLPDPRDTPRGRIAAAGLAQINALGNLASFFFNYMIGWIRDETGSYAAALMPIALVATIGMICVLVIGRGQPRTTAVAVVQH